MVFFAMMASSASANWTKCARTNLNKSEVGQARRSCQPPRASFEGSKPAKCGSSKITYKPRYTGSTESSFRSSTVERILPSNELRRMATMQTSLERVGQLALM